MYALIEKFTQTDKIQIEDKNLRLAVVYSTTTKKEKDKKKTSFSRIWYESQYFSIHLSFWYTRFMLSLHSVAISCEKMCSSSKLRLAEYLWYIRICLCDYAETQKQRPNQKKIQREKKKRAGNISTLYTNKIDLGSRISRTHTNVHQRLIASFLSVLIIYRVFRTLKLRCYIFFYLFVLYFVSVTVVPFLPPSVRFSISNCDNWFQPN